jgi:hypothetical protein
LSDAEAANLIFMPGLSTADQVTELAGRGIGMDVVRSEVNALGGRIETSTKPGLRAPPFKLVLPLTTAVTQVVMLRVGDFTIGVPSGTCRDGFAKPIPTGTGLPNTAFDTVVRTDCHFSGPVRFCRFLRSSNEARLARPIGGHLP